MVYDGYIRINTKIDARKATSSLMTIQNSMEKTDAKIEKLQKRLEELGDEKIETEEFKELNKEIAATGKKLEDARSKLEKFQEVHPGDDSSTRFKNLQGEVNKLQNAFNELGEAHKRLIADNKTFISGINTTEYQKVSEQLEEQQKKMEVLNARYAEHIKKQEQAKQKQNEFAASGKKTSSILKTISNRFKGLMLSMLLFNNITKAFNAAVSAIKAGLQNYAGYSDEYNASVSELLGSLETLKNSMAAAFAPVVQAIVPVLNTLVNTLIDATNAIAQFIAALSGKNTWTKAVRQVKDYRTELEGAAKSANKALAPFDELTVMNENNSSNSGGSGSAGSSDTFTTEEISSNIWAELENGFYGIGQKVSENLAKELKNIDWGQIQDKAKKIASNIAQFINGFLSNPQTAYDIGRTLAELLNTGVDFLLTLIGEIDWFMVAYSCFELLKGFFENLDYDDIAVLIGLGLAGIGISFIKEQFGIWVAKTLGPALLAVLTTDLATVFAAESLAPIAATLVTGLAGALLAGFLGFELGKWLNENDVLGLGTWADSVAPYWADRIEACGGSIALGVLKGIADGFVYIGQWLKEFVFDPIIKWIKSLFGINSPSKVMLEMGGYVAQGFVNGIASMPEQAVEVFKKVISRGKEFVADMKEKFNGITTYLCGTFKTKWTNGWKNVAGGATSIFTNMWSGIKKVINWLIEGVEGMANRVVAGINWVIDGINSMLSINIPATAITPAINLGGSVIPRLTEVSIPRLATGGITTGRTIAEIGENGREAVLPLENNTEWMDELADKINKGGQYTFIAKLDGKVIFEQTVKQDEMYEDTHGHSAFDR